jgi:phenylacetate-CoA ligase
MKDKIYNLVPNFFQNTMVSLFNFLVYKKRYGGKYKQFKKLFFKNRNLTRLELLDNQKKRFSELILKSKSNSVFYFNLYEENLDSNEIENIDHLPIVNKEMLRANINDIVINTNENLIKSKTGGTTGKSLEVKYTKTNMQERFAMLDDFRSRFGYELGKKTAWFSGKSLLTQRDVKKNRFWKKDFLHKVKYYSTFHIKSDYLKYYVEDLIKFRPQYLVGFPSSILEIAKYGLNNEYDFPEKVVKAVFPTAESINKEMRSVIEKFFKTKLYDQYASSEGAPFIFECKKGNLHLELQSGVFEVLDKNNQPARSGKLLVTSFTTEATPLIRYDIGDSITLEDPNKICDCGNNNPMVKEILGRIDDFIYSPENGKINLGNISNTLKGTKGIRKFQVIQNKINKINVLLVVDYQFDKKSEKALFKNWIDRLGNKMQITLEIVDEIEVEKSGKFRMVKNNIKHLLN